MSVSILIRDVPDEVRDILAEQARIRGQSMQAYLQEVLASQVRLNRNMALIDRARATGRGVVEPGAAARMISDLRDGTVPLRGPSAPPPPQ